MGTSITPTDAECASEREGKHSILFDGESTEKEVGFPVLFIASRIAAQLNAQLYPREGAAATQVPIHCFSRPDHARKPNVVYLCLRRCPGGKFPTGEINFVPVLVVEVLSPSDDGIEADAKLTEYLEAGIPLVWIVNPESRNIRIYRNDGTTRLFRGTDAMENEPLLPGFRLVVAEVFPLCSDILPRIRGQESR